MSCSVIAAFDELIQLAVAGRASDPRDMALNLLGVSIGIIIGVLVTHGPPR